MKKTFLLIALALFLGMVLCPLADIRAEIFEPEANIEGTWNATGTWESGSSWDEIWVINQTGPVYKISSDSGWSAQGVTFGSLVIFKIISSGCYPIYLGNSSGSSMGGRMKCTTSSERGTWSATRSAFVEPPSEDSYDTGASSACPN
ncbi:MAG: hypothetical protein NT096_07650 [Proteobacteria bacterium]|nr:hypothetical protein [Pseudomonadota bacterium]